MNGSKTTHVWDGGDIVMELNNSGIVTDRYVRGIGLIKSDGNGYYLFNAHGDVIGLTNVSGLKTKDYRYDAFGVEVNQDKNDVNPFRFCAEYFDKETNTIYLRNRYYNPMAGRFSSEDQTRDGLNFYTYCNGNPVLFIDPSGYWAKPYTDKNGVYHGDPDYEEFYGSLAYQSLSDLTESYGLAKTDDMRKSIDNLSNEIRKIARRLGPENLIYKNFIPKNWVDYELNPTEQILLMGDSFNATLALVAGQDAANLVYSMYGQKWGIANELDAVRHATWSYMVAYRTNKNFAKFWTDAHECGTPANFSDIVTEHAGTTRYEQTIIDLYNNSIGINAALGWWQKGEYLTPYQLAKIKASQWIDDGSLNVLIK